MAENKKSFIAYSDWDGMFQALPDEVAGKLIKHIFAYVNDRNPTSEDFIINALFEQVKSTLKRDLVKWEQQRDQRVIAGKKSAAIRATKTNDRSTTVDETERKPTVSVSVSDNVNVKERVNTLTHSHSEVVNQTLENEIFLEQSAMALSTDIKTFKEFVKTKLAEMAITGQSSKYPLGTVKRIIIQDFKIDREAKKRFPQKEESKPAYHKHVKFT